jgi:alpha-D-ribose 1-methylphosphonate 5-triphosphate synthase subunit PhnI
MYVAVKGGERAIDNAHRLLARERRGDPSVPELSLAQIEQQLALAVDRVMTEGSLHDRALAALAVKQSRGDLIEAIFLLRAYRTTLPRLGVSLPLDTAAMVVHRRVSAIFKDLPGARSSAPRSTTRIGYSISSWPIPVEPRQARPRTAVARRRRHRCPG